MKANETTNNKFNQIENHLHKVCSGYDTKLFHSPRAQNHSHVLFRTIIV